MKRIYEVALRPYRVLVDVDEARALFPRRSEQAAVEMAVESAVRLDSAEGYPVQCVRCDDEPVVANVALCGRVMSDAEMFSEGLADAETEAIGQGEPCSF